MTGSHGTSLTAVRCAGCGGIVSAASGISQCLFCGATDLAPTEPPEGIEPPVGYLPFVCGESQATEQFQRFAGSSIWYPNDLRSARVTLRRLQVPAWAWSVDVETHWTGIVRAPETRSDKRPVSGADSVRFDQLLVPSSSALRQSELRDLGAYDERALQAGTQTEDPQEISELTRSAARARAQGQMVERHRNIIASRQGLISIRSSSVVTDLQGKPVLVPVYIGAFRYGERTFRFLVNGQTGKLVGSAPISPYKVALAILGVIVSLAVLIGIVALMVQ